MINPITYIRRMITGSGIESFQRYYACYRGTVVDNKDPENMARLKIRCPSVWKTETHDEWVFPKGLMSGKGWGFYAIPQPGDGIYVSFENGDPSFPIWEYGYWYKDQLPEKAKTDNKNNYLFQTPKGQRIEFNDQEEKIIITDKSGNVLEMSEKGFQLKKGPVTAADLFSELFTLFEATTVLTPLIGPQPFINVAAYSALKAKFKQFFY